MFTHIKTLIMKKLCIADMETLSGGSISYGVAVTLDMGCLAVGTFMGLAIPVFGFIGGLACSAIIQYAYEH